MSRVITKGKTVELATRQALEQLGVSRDRVRVSVLTEPKPRLFGLFGTKDAVVEVEVLPAAPALEVLEAPPEVIMNPPVPFDSQSDPVEEAAEFVRRVLQDMHLQDIELHVMKKSEQSYLFQLQGTNLGRIIGRHGSTLDSLQFLTNLVANKQARRAVRIMLDAENYRERRTETLEKLAERLADKVVKSGKQVLLEPMPSADRKVIHTYLQSRRDVVTFSQGGEPYRRIVIAPKGELRPRAKKTKTKSTTKNLV